MDNLTIARIIAGVIAVVLVAIIIARRKRMAATKRMGARR